MDGKNSSNNDGAKTTRDSALSPSDLETLVKVSTKYCKEALLAISRWESERPQQPNMADNSSSNNNDDANTAQISDLGGSFLETQVKVATENYWQSLRCLSWWISNREQIVSQWGKGEKLYAQTGCGMAKASKPFEALKLPYPSDDVIQDRRRQVSCGEETVSEERLISVTKDKWNTLNRSTSLSS